MSSADAAARLDRLPVSGWHRRVVALVGLAMLVTLYQVLIGAVVADAAAQRWQLGGAEHALLTGATFLGMAVGAIALGGASDRVGRQRVLIAGLSASSFFSLVSAASPNVGALAALRALTGIGVGASLIVADSYLAELMPASVRGRLTGWAYAAGLTAVPLAWLLGGRAVAGHPLLIDGWRWLAIAGGIGLLAARSLRRELPESPRWLAGRGRGALAADTLAEIEHRVQAELGHPLPGPRPGPVPAATPTLAETLRSGYRHRTIMLWAINVLRGVGFYGFAVLAPLVLMSKGFSVADSLGFVAASCLAYPVGAALSTGLLDRFERKNLLPVAAIAVAVLGLVFGSAADSALVVVSGLLLALSFALLTTCFHVYQAEVVPSSTRGSATGLAYGLGCAVVGALSFSTDWLVANAGAASLSIATAIAVLGLGAAAWHLGPESTARTLERASLPGDSDLFERRARPRRPERPGAGG